MPQKTLPVATPPPPTAPEQQVIDTLLTAIEAVHGKDSAITLGAEWQMLQAFQMTAHLDRLAGSGSRAFHTRLLTELALPEAADIVRQGGALKLDRRAYREAAKAIAAGKDPGPAITALNLRESLRDGWTLPQVLHAWQDRIAEHLATGDTTLPLAIREITREFQRHPDAFQRSLETWLLKAWLPLGLWRCRGAALEERVHAAHALLSASGVRLPALPDSKHLDTLARKVRSRWLTGAR